MIAALVGLCGIVLSGLGWWLDPARFYHAWLAALSVWLGWPLGSMALLMIHAMTGGRWGQAIQPALRDGLATLPLLLPAAAPLWLGMPALYPWLHHDVPNAFWLNAPFFTARLLSDAIIWFGLGILVLRNARRVAPPGLILLALSLSFAATDLTMSLDPAFNSSIYGLVAIASAVLLALALAVQRSVRRTSLSTSDDLSKLVLGLVILWAYLAFMQFLIIWEGDLPTESAWYVAREKGIWGTVGLATVAAQFAAPFALLVTPAFRRSRRGIAGICLVLVAAECVRGWWLVLPAHGGSPGWLECACLAALFGTGAALAARRPHNRTITRERAHV